MEIKVLFIDDDILLGNIVTLALNSLGFKVSFQNTLVGAKGAIKEFNPDAIILDIALNGEDGISFIPSIKDISPTTPIIVASSHTDYQEIERAFNAGAVDFLKKPYVPEELSIYIKKNITVHTPHIIHVGKLMLDTSSRVLSTKDMEIKRLSILEYKLLKLLHNNLGSIVPRDEIGKELWGKEEVINNFSLNNLVNSIRKLISNDPTLILSTFKGAGYSLRLNSASK